METQIRLCFFFAEPQAADVGHIMQGMALLGPKPKKAELYKQPRERLSISSLFLSRRL